MMTVAPSRFTIGAISSDDSEDLEQTPSGVSLAATYAQHNYLECEGAHISPRRLQFSNTATQSICKQTVTIRNCCEHSIFVRIEEPNNREALKIKAIIKGEHIPPGFSLSREVEYKYQLTTTKCYYYIPIFIGDSRILYKVVVNPLVAVVLVEPTSIDFGMMDLGMGVTRRTLRIRNIGTRPTRYSIDLGPNELQIRVDPQKGVIKPKSDTEVTLEITPTEEGDFHTKFYVKTVSVFEIIASGKVTMGKLEVINRLSCATFTMIDFPPTFYGAKSVQQLVIRNNCASRAVFCVLFEGANDKTFDSLAEVIKQRPQMKRFSVVPIDGRLEPRESRIITVTYEPGLHLSYKNQHVYDLAIMQIKKLNNCKDLNIKDYPDGLYTGLQDFTDDWDSKRSRGASYCESQGTVDTRVRAISQTSGLGSDDSYLELLNVESLVDLSSTFQVCMYGEPENVKVTITPDLIVIKDMVLNKYQDRVILISNKSNSLPVIFSYVKVAGIDVKPKSGTLKQKSGCELMVSLVATKYGSINTQVAFELFSYNQPYMNDESEKQLVGTISIDVKIHAKTVTKHSEPRAKPTFSYVDQNIPKKAKALVIVRPITVPDSYKPKITKPASFERYHFSREQKILNSLAKEFYQKYLHQNRLHQMKMLRDDLISKHQKSHLKLFLIYSAFVELSSEVSSSFTGFCDGFVPLTPMQLNNIIIDPIHIIIGKVSSYSSAEKSFRIINRNKNTIRAFLIPEKQRCTFPKGQAMFIPGQSTQVIDFRIFTENEGFSSSGIHIVVNECHVFDISMTMTVVNRKLRYASDIVTFDESGLPYKYFELYNNLNVPIDYEWDCSQTNFEVTPAYARIEPNSRISCMLEHNPLSLLSSSHTITLTTGMRNSHKIFVTAPAYSPSIYFTDTTIDFAQVAMNLRSVRTTVLWNTGQHKLFYIIKKPAKMAELEILPHCGVIYGRSCQVIKLAYRSQDCIDFNIKLSVIINNMRDFAYLHVIGRVVFPQLAFRPTQIRTRMPITAYKLQQMSIENLTDAKVYVTITPPFLISADMQSKRMTNCSILIEKRSVVNLVVHLTSPDVTNTNLYAPIQINSILGPPFANNSATLKTSTYVGGFLNLHCPPTIPYQSNAMHFHESLFKVSRYKMDFYYTPYCTTNNVLADQTTFTNISDAPINICVRTDELREHFYISVEQTCEIVEHTYSIVFEIPPGDEVTLHVKFAPGGPGQFKCNLPFYVRNYYKNDVHNILALKAEYALPDLIAPKQIYFDYLPLQQSCQRNFAIKAYKHQTSCEIRWCVDSYDVMVKINGRTTKCYELIDVTLIYTPYYSGALKSTVKFQCDCGSTVEVVCIGGSENSIFTNYRTFIPDDLHDPSQRTISDIGGADINMSTRKVSYYPSFPENNHPSYKFLNSTVAIVEEWISNQVFYGKFTFIIPQSLSRITETPPLSHKNLTKTHIIPYLEMLKHVSSLKTVTDFKLLRPIPEKYSQRVTFLYDLYKDLLLFLEDVVGAILPHVKPEYLLPFDYYEYYMKYVVNNVTKLHMGIDCQDEKRFVLRSKQCWLDVVLQTIKLFVIQRSCSTDHSSGSGSSASTNIISGDMRSPSIRRKTLSSNASGFPSLVMSRMSDTIQMCYVYSIQEEFLMNWMNSHLKSHKHVLFGNATSVIVRTVDNFECSIRDGFAFAAVTIAYCPYLMSHLEHMYWNPTTTAQYHHNAASLIRAWSEVNCIFNLAPADIYDPHTIRMALLVHYLHEFLPTLQPATDIQITAPLSGTATIQVSITNSNNFQVNYRVLFFGADRSSFSTIRDVITVKRHTTELVAVKYFAKFMKRVTVVLVFCGEARGSKSARSCAYTLVGTPDIGHVTTEFTFKIRLYTVHDKAIDIQSPYPSAGIYDIYYSIEQPTVLDTLVLHNYELVVQERLPSRVFYDGSQIFFNEKGQASITVTIGCLSWATRSVWYFLRNPLIGDFCIKFTIATLSMLEPQKIVMQVPDEAYAAVCVCNEKGSNTSCKKNVSLRLPKRNEEYYEAFLNMFIKLKRDNNEFWVDYIGKISSMRHLERDLAGKWNPDMWNVVRMLTEDRDYKVAISGANNEISVDNVITIADMARNESDKFVNLRIHVGNQKVARFQLSLNCKKFHEHRIYDVVVSNRKSVTR